MLSLLLFLACADNSFVPHCESAESPVGWDEATALGISAGDVIDRLGTDHDADLSWEVGGGSPLRVTLDSTGDAVFVDQWEAEAPPNASIALIGIDCPDYLALDLGMGLATDDGGLAEDFDVRLSAGPPAFGSDDDPLEYSVWLQTQPERFAGSVDLSAADNPDYDSSSVSLSSRFYEGGGTDGQLAVEGQGETEDSAWAVSVPIATWTRVE